MSGMELGGLTWGVAAPAMLWGLLGVSIPVVIHLLNRRRADVVEWAAMQFLTEIPRDERRFHLTELLLMLARMALLALVALAVARPLIGARNGEAAVGQSRPPVTAGARGGATEPRDVVLILDGSRSMARRVGDRSARQAAIAWARDMIGALAPGSSVALIDARERVTSVIDPPSFDLKSAREALETLREPRGSSNLPAALADAMRILETTRNAARDIIILTDGQRVAWRSGEAARWNLLRDVYRENAARRKIAPRIWAMTFDESLPTDAADGGVVSIEVGRSLSPVGLPVDVTAQIENAGPGSLERTAELLVDGTPIPRVSQHVGPLPPGGKTRVSFQTDVLSEGSHLATVRLAQSDDPLPANDERSQPFQVARAIPVVLVGDAPARRALESWTAFTRAALMPSGDSAPVFDVRVLPAEQFEGDSLNECRVVVLANVAGLTPAQLGAVDGVLARGGGVLLAPAGRSVEQGSTADAWPAWLPARMGEPDGGQAMNELRPAPASFAGSWMSRFAGQGTVALARARFLRHVRLEPTEGSTVLASFDSGEPWIVERAAGRGRVVMLAAPLDVAWSSLPINADFVPWIHTMMLELASRPHASSPLRPGEPLRLELSPRVLTSVTSARVRLPDGRDAEAHVVHRGNAVHLEFDGTEEPGVYRVECPGPDGGNETTYVLVEEGAQESDPARLEEEEARQLASGWPFTFVHGRDEAVHEVLATAPAGPRAIWRWLVLAALLGLCVEVLTTRAVARRRAPAGGVA